MAFNHATEMPTGSSSLEVSLDDKCVKFWQQYVNDGKCSNQVHYLGREHIQELIDYLKGSLTAIEMQMLEVGVV